MSALILIISLVLLILLIIICIELIFIGLKHLEDYRNSLLSEEELIEKKKKQDEKDIQLIIDFFSGRRRYRSISLLEFLSSSLTFFLPLVLPLGLAFVIMYFLFNIEQKVSYDLSFLVGFLFWIIWHIYDVEKIYRL